MSRVPERRLFYKTNKMFLRKINIAVKYIMNVCNLDNIYNSQLYLAKLTRRVKRLITNYGFINHGNLRGSCLQNSKICRAPQATETSKAHQGRSTSFPGSLFFYSIVGQGVAWSSSLRGGGGFITGPQ